MSGEKSFHIGIRIKELREKSGMTQEDLAKLIGYKSRSTINKIEMGKNDIPQNKIEKFAKALRVPPISLMGWDIPEINLNSSDAYCSLKTLRQSYLPDSTVYKLQTEIFKMNNDNLERLLEYALFLNR